MTTASLEEIEKLRKPERGVWQEVPKMKDMQDAEISRIGVLTNAKGEMIGQMIIGKPISRTALTRQDLTEVEMIVNLMAVVIENGSRKS
jgi:hypothetical protein